MTTLHTNTALPGVSHLMRLVLAALIPGTAVFIYQTGWGGVINLLLAIIAAVVFEAIAVKLRRRSVRTSLEDYSAVVTGWLIALCLPPLLAWWLPVLAAAFAILLAKHLFGGLGQNIFNPAMAGYALLLISYPLDLGLWLNTPEAFNLSLHDSIAIVMNGGVKLQANWDALTGATALDQHRGWLLQTLDNPTPPGNTFGTIGAAHSEWANMAFLVGGIWLWHKRIIQWQIPLAFIVTLLLCTTIGNLINPLQAGPGFHLFGGATMLGAFFIATDPVSAAASNRARLIYAAGAGGLVYLIRTFGAFPDAVAFAILLMNCVVPALDRMDIWLLGRNNEAPKQ